MRYLLSFSKRATYGKTSDGHWVGYPELIRSRSLEEVLEPKSFAPGSKLLAIIFFLKSTQTRGTVGRNRPAEPQIDKN